MTPYEIWQTFGLPVLIVVVAIGLIVLWARTWLVEEIRAAVKSDYDKELVAFQSKLRAQNDHDLERHKDQLKRESDVELALLRNRLDLTAAQQQVKFAHLHERRAEVIAEVYAALQTFVQAVAQYTQPFEPVGMPSKDIRLSEAVNAGNAFVTMFWAKQIFIPHATAVKLSQLRDQYRRAMVEFQFGVDFPQRSGSSAGTTDKWLEIFQRVDQLSKTGLVDLENDFRRLLGDDT